MLGGLGSWQRSITKAMPALLVVLYAQLGSLTAWTKTSVCLGENSEEVCCSTSVVRLVRLVANTLPIETLLLANLGLLNFCNLLAD